MDNDSTFPDSKLCRKCGETKPPEMFSKRKGVKDGLNSHCKACHKTYCAERAKIDRVIPSEKQCNTCGETKPKAMFASARGARDGLNPQCKRCKNSYDRANKNKFSDRLRKWRQANYESRQLKHRAWRRANKQRQSIERPLNKYCPRCEENKLGSDFSLCTSNKDGLNSICKKCAQLAFTLYSASHRHELSEKHREWRLLNPERFRKWSRDYRSKNRVRLKIQKQKWDKENQEYVRAYRRFTNERSRERARELRKKYPDKYRAYTHRRLARLAQVEGRGVTAIDMQAMIYIQQGLCAYCERDGQKLTLDHIIPLVQSGPHDPDNCCMACGTCNSSKGGRTPEQWTTAGRWFD